MSSQSSTSGAGSPAAPSAYSLAFDRLVDGPDDLAGLVAYALYKQSINEKAKAGQPLPREYRVPSETDVKTFREAADRRLQDFGTAAIGEAREDIVATGTGLVVQAAKAEIIQKVTERTSVGTAVMISLLGWVLSIALTLLIIYGATQPSLQDCSSVSPGQVTFAENHRANRCSMAWRALAAGLVRGSTSA